MAFAAEKVASTGNQNILLCEARKLFWLPRFSGRYAWTSLMKQSGFPVVYDATHSVQQMGGGNGSSGGVRSFVQPLARAAVATGVDGVFFECHDNPDKAPSDGPCMLPLEQVSSFVTSLCQVRAAVADTI